MPRAHRNQGSCAALSVAVGRLAGNLSGDAARYLERRVINEGREEFGVRRRRPANDQS